MHFNEKFQVSKLYITSFGNWVISLRPEQLTLGSLILSLSRPCLSLANLTENEVRDLGLSFKFVENLLKEAFSPEKINYLALMMVDTQVHFHIIPRYEKIIIFNGIEYKDLCWPGAHNLTSILNLKAYELEDIYRFLLSMVENVDL